MKRENFTPVSGEYPQNGFPFPLIDANYELQFRIAARTVLRKQYPIGRQDLTIALADEVGRITSVLFHPECCPIASLLAKESTWSNRIIGPNGLGNSIIAKKPVVVKGNEHTHPQLKECFTIGYPVIRADLGLVGAIMLAGKSDTYDHNLLDWIDTQITEINKYIDTDQTARTMAKSMLLEENMRLVAANSENQTSQLGIAIIGVHGRVIELSTPVQALISCAKGEFLDANRSELEKLLLAQIDECLTTRTTCCTEISPSVSEIHAPITIFCQPLIDTINNTPIGVMIFFDDPTFTQRQGMTSRQALAHLAEDVVILDQAGRIVFGNRFPPEELGRHYLDVVFNGQKYQPGGEHNSLLIQALESKQDAITRIYQTQDGTRTLQIDIRLLKDRGTNLVGVVGIRKDITKNQLPVGSERSSTVGELAAQTIHELRNPLAAIRASAQLALHLNESDKDAILTQIISEIDKINDFVSNILFLAKPSQTAFQAENLAKIVDKVLDLEKANILRFGITIIKNYAQDKLSPIKGNAKLLEQALLNIVNNALEVMDQGGTLTITILDSPYDTIQKLIIADTGPGMNAQQMENMFKPFYTTKGDRGTDLGLTITKQIVSEIHGGKVWLESEPGRGTQVHVELGKMGLRI